MVNVKLGNLTFEGVDNVKLDTVDGGEVVFTLESNVKAKEAAIISRTLSGEYRNDATFENLGVYTFYDSYFLESIDLPNATGEVGESCFDLCKNLKSVNLPKVEKLYDFAFRTCENLTVLDFPRVHMVSVTAFSECYKLKAVVLRTVYSDTVNFRWSDYVESPADAFWGSPIHDGTGYFYVPRELIPVWQTSCADMELTIGNQFRPLEDYTIDGTITGELDLTKMGL